VCPACIATVALMVAGTTSTGGLTALVKDLLSAGNLHPANESSRFGNSAGSIRFISDCTSSLGLRRGFQRRKLELCV